jgi:hypothetical protein
MSTRNKVSPVEVNGTRLRAGDTVLVKREEAVFLGMWDGMCWFSFVDEDEVIYLHRGFFKQNVT